MDAWAERILPTETERLTRIVDATVNTTYALLATPQSMNPIAWDVTSTLFQEKQELLGQQLYRVAVLEDHAGLQKAGVLHAQYARNVFPDVRKPETFLYFDPFWVLAENEIFPIMIPRPVQP